jgi:uncharacterized protein YbbK (DUF523 family)
MKKTVTAEYIVSACLAGVKCRYDGESNTINEIVNMVKNGNAVALCPEVMGGLSTPRIPCEIKKNKDESLEIIDKDNNNHTAAFIRGARLALDAAVNAGITKAILKQRSPSCGCGLIYDGTFSGKLIEGNGITAELFLKSGIKVITEIEFENLQSDI